MHGYFTRVYWDGMLTVLLVRISNKVNVPLELDTPFRKLTAVRERRDNICAGVLISQLVDVEPGEIQSKSVLFILNKCIMTSVCLGK